MESFWGCAQAEEHLSNEEKEHCAHVDDEMLCWSALLQVSQQQERQMGAPLDQNDDSSCSSFLLDFAKHSTTGSTDRYPLWNQVRCLTSYLIRHEYYAAWKHIDTITASAPSNSLPILFKCCIEPNLQFWRHRTIQQYNTSFAKEESVTSVPRLLGIPVDEWNIQRAGEFGLPTEQKENGMVALVFKKVPLEDQSLMVSSAGTLRRRDHQFTFGKLHDATEKLRIASIHVEQILKGWIEYHEFGMLQLMETVL